MSTIFLFICVRYLLVLFVLFVFVIKRGYLEVKRRGSNVYYEYCGIILISEFDIYH
jgi:hypothetical protein